MPAYDATDFQPPAPCVQVVVRSLDTGSNRDQTKFQIDTGADASVIPRTLISQLGIQAESIVVPVVGVEGKTIYVQTAKVALSFLGKVFRGEFLVTDTVYGIIGRDILQLLVIRFDGPKSVWDEV